MSAIIASNYIICQYRWRSQRVRVSRVNHIRRGPSEKNRLSRATVEVCPRIQDHIAWLVQELNDLDTDLRGKIRQSPVWREMDDLLRSVPGVGPQLSLTLLAQLPELGTLDRKQIAALGRVHTNSAEMLSSRHGDYRSSVRTHSAGPAGSARQRQTAELAGAQRDPVCRRAGLQVARAAAPLRQLAYRLHTDEPLVEEWGARPGV